MTTKNIESLDSEEMINKVIDGMKNLQYKEIILLKKQGLSNEELAEKLHITKIDAEPGYLGRYNACHITAPSK